VSRTGRKLSPFPDRKITAGALCGLFAKEYGGPNGLTFHHAPAASISTPDQMLLDEAIQWLEVYSDHDPGVYDPPPTKDMITLAQYAVRAREWEAQLREKAAEAEAVKAPTPSDATESPPLTADEEEIPATCRQNPNQAFLYWQSFEADLACAVAPPCRVSVAPLVFHLAASPARPWAVCPGCVRANFIFFHDPDRMTFGAKNRPRVRCVRGCVRADAPGFIRLRADDVQGGKTKNPGFH
jgi:hypothetical protein